MFIFFHIAIPLLFAEIPFIKRKLSLQHFSLIIGSILPDLIDKPLALLGFGDGRYLGHAPFILAIFLCIIFLITRNKSIVYALGIGCIFHLILDLPYIPFFYPFIQYIFPVEGDLLNGWFYTLTHNPLVISTEIIGVITLLGIAIKYKMLFHWENIKSYLFKIVLQLKVF
jgi:hypothetical protein